MFATASEIVRRRELLWILVARNLKIRYKGSALGFFWSLLGPLCLIVIYAVFLRLIRFSIPRPVLVTGILVWQFLATCLGDALYAVVGNANLVTKAAFPRIMLPMAMVAANLVNFLLSCVVLGVYLAVAGADWGAVYWFPAILLTQTALCFGVSLVLSAANVFFRDTQHILSVVMLAWFFMTPVIYPVSLVRAQQFPSWVETAFFANPMTGILSAYRTVLLSAEAAPAGLMALSFAVAWLALAAGLWIFQRVQPAFGDEL